MRGGHTGGGRGGLRGIMSTDGRPNTKLPAATGAGNRTGKLDGVPRVSAAPACSKPNTPLRRVPRRRLDPATPLLTSYHAPRKRCSNPPPLNSMPLSGIVAMMVVAGSVLASWPLSGQELGVHVAFASSDHREFPSPRGFTISMAAPVRAGWEGWVTLYRVADETLKDGVVCRVALADGLGCEVEPVRTRVSLAGFRGGVARSLQRGDGLGARLASGLSFNQVSARAEGVSGRRAGLLTPNGGQIGLFGALLLLWRPVETLPLRLAGRLEFHRVSFSACAHPTVPVYDPFCEAGTFREVGLGVWWAPGGR